MIIGGGSYAKIYIEHSKDGFTDHAIKKYFKSQNWKKSAFREISSMKSFSHPNILPLLSFSKDLHLCLPRMEKNLLQHLKTNVISNETVLKWSKDLVSAVSHVHKNNFIHRDIKLENILVLKNSIYLADFGLSRRTEAQEPSEMSGNVCSLWTRAPELLQQRDKSVTKYTKKIDAWALGCVILALGNGYYPFTGKTEKELLVNIEKNKEEQLNLFFTRNISELNSCIHHLLNTDPAHRISVEEISETLLIDVPLENKKAITQGNPCPYILNWIKTTCKALGLSTSTSYFAFCCWRRYSIKTLLVASSCCSLVTKLIEHVNIHYSFWAKSCQCKITDVMNMEISILQELDGNIFLSNTELENDFLK